MARIVTMRKQLLWILPFLVLFLFVSPSHASLIAGSDWNGLDFTPRDGDSLSGVFTPAPLPSSLLLFGPAIAGLGVLRRKYRR